MSKEKFPHDITQWDDDEIIDAFQDDPKQFLAQFAGQLTREQRHAYNFEHPVSAAEDERILAMHEKMKEGKRVHESDKNRLIAARLRERRGGPRADDDEAIPEEEGDF